MQFAKNIFNLFRRRETAQFPRLTADKAILAYAELYAFGASDNFSATGLSQAQGNTISAEVTQNILALGFEMRQRYNEGATISTLKNDSQFQNQAFQAITHFIDNLPLNKPTTIEIACEVVEGEGGEFYYAPENPEILKNFLATNFVIDANDGQKETEQFFGFVFAPGNGVSEKIPEIKNLENSNKDDEWLIYWYACGTDIETTRIVFNPNSNVAANQIIIGDKRCPGDITRAIHEIERADISSDKVKVLMQAGGTYVWGHEKFQNLNATISQIRPEAKAYLDGKGGRFLSNKNLPYNWSFYKKSYKEGIEIVNPGKIGRYVYGRDGRDWQPRQILQINSSDPRTDMGTKEGLINFLEYGKNLEAELFPGKNIHRVFIFRDHGGFPKWRLILKE